MCPTLGLILILSYLSLPNTRSATNLQVGATRSSLVSTLSMSKLCNTEFYLEETHRESKGVVCVGGKCPRQSWEEQVFKEDAGVDREEGVILL